MDSSWLPVYGFKRQVIRAVEQNDALVVVAETGSGKSTLIPQFLHDSGLTKHGKITVTQPRRIGAISLASRVSDEMGCKLGSLVGYQVRFDDCTSSDTRIKYVTDGCLLREFIDDPELLDYSVVVLDEAHERSLDTDILFGLIKRLFISKPSKTPTRKHPLKILVMSASLDHEKFANFFGSCPVLEIPGRSFPVKTVYCNHVGKENINTPNYLTKAVKKAMEVHTECPPGHILVFLTGQDEIERCCDQLFVKAENIDYRYDVSSRRVNAMLVLPLYGSMPTELQKRVFAPVEDGVRKVVVATNIAATSLTIEGIRYIIDCGYVKQLSFNPRTGLDSLNIVLISRSEALQRAGRAGRTTDGICYRLYTRDVHDDVMSEETAPEIQRTNLAKVVLYLKTMGVHDVVSFDYIDPPEERMVIEAARQLYILGALDRDGDVTADGHSMVLFPLSPCLSRCALASLQFNCSESMLIIAAMLSVEDVFLRPGNREKLAKASGVWEKLATKAGGANDFLTLLCIFEECFKSADPAKWCREHFVHWRALRTASNIVEQLKSIIQRQKIERHFEKRVEHQEEKEAILKALCQGLFYNTARKGTGNSFRTMDGRGTTVFIHPSSAMFNQADFDWILFHDVIWTSKIYAKTVCPIKYETIHELLPRIHEATNLNLAGGRSMQAKNDDSCYENEDKHYGEAVLQHTKSTARRNTEQSILAAKERYLARKSSKRQDTRE